MNNHTNDNKDLSKLFIESERDQKSEGKHLYFIKIIHSCSIYCFFVRLFFIIFISNVLHDAKSIIENKYSQLNVNVLSFMKYYVIYYFILVIRTNTYHL